MYVSECISLLTMDYGCYDTTGYDYVLLNVDDEIG